MADIDRRLARWGFRAALAVVLVAVIGGVGLFVHMLAVRTEWKGDRLKLADAFGDAARGGRCTMRCGDEVIAAPPQAVDFFYNQFIMSPDTVPLSSGIAETAQNAICLTLPRATVIFTPVGDGVNTNVQWTCDGAQKGYTVRGVLPYSHLEQYFKNNVYWNSLEAKD